MDRPDVSVVIAVAERPDALPRVLAALSAQAGFDRCEVLLADGTPHGLAADEDRFPWIRRMPLPGANLPALKGAAIGAARGLRVAILDPHDVPAPGWIEAITVALPAEEAQPVAVGGVVHLDGPASAGNGGAYLFEYGAFNPPIPTGPTGADLPGNNVAYRTDVLRNACRTILEVEGFNKPFVHEGLRAGGGRLDLVDTMEVAHRPDHAFGPVAVRRFDYGRCFGARRRARAGAGRKAALVLLVPVVPALLVVRHLLRAARHPSNRALVWGWAGVGLVGICLAWGMGEWVGTWFGPGRSCERFV